MNCGDCRHWHEQGEYAAEGRYGECRQGPPTANYSPHGTAIPGRGRWYITLAGEGCGAFEHTLTDDPHSTPGPALRKQVSSAPGPSAPNPDEARTTEPQAPAAPPAAAAPGSTGGTTAAQGPSRPSPALPDSRGTQNRPQYPNQNHNQRRGNRR